MRINLLILLAISSFILFSCDDGINLSECGSEIIEMPCYDSTSHLIWSEKYDWMFWEPAIDHCTGLNSSHYGGFSSGWHLPTIGELRTLIQNCSNTQMPDGSCNAIDSCSLSDEYVNDACSGCAYDKNNPGQYSKFGDTERFWSSSIVEGSCDVYHVDFNNGSVDTFPNDGKNFYVRCVR